MERSRISALARRLSRRARAARCGGSAHAPALCIVRSRGRSVAGDHREPHENRTSQLRRLVEIAAGVAAAPNRGDLAATLMTYPVHPARWTEAQVDISSKDAG